MGGRRGKDNCDSSRDSAGVVTNASVRGRQETHLARRQGAETTTRVEQIGRDQGLHSSGRRRARMHAGLHLDVGEVRTTATRQLLPVNSCGVRSTSSRNNADRGTGSTEPMLAKDSERETRSMLKVVRMHTIGWMQVHCQGQMRKVQGAGSESGREGRGGGVRTQR